MFTWWPQYLSPYIKQRSSFLAFFLTVERYSLTFYVISHFLQIRVQAINTLAFIFDLLIFEGNHLENKKCRFFLRKCLSISLKMKPFSKLTSHRLCQQPKCPQTSAGLAQSVDRQHCGRSLVWAPRPDLHSGSLKNKSERKVLLLFCGLDSLTRRQNSALN